MSGTLKMDAFWDVIEKTLPSDEGQQDRLFKLFESATCDERKQFGLAFLQAKEDAYRWDVWAAAYLYNGGCSDDSFSDFRTGVISMGREVYHQILENPDDLVTVLDQGGKKVDVFDEEFGYSYMHILKMGGCENLSPSDVEGQVVANAHPLSAHGRDNDWDFDDDGEMQRRYPKIWSRVEEAL